MKKLILTLCLCGAGIGCAAAKTYEVTSPDGKIAVQVDAGKEAVSYTVQLDGKTLIAPSYLALELADGRTLGTKPVVRKASVKSFDQTIDAPFYKRAEIEDRYNELTLAFKCGYEILFRAYDEGVAYRFRTSLKEEIVVADELVDIRFPEDFKAWVPYVNADPAGKFRPLLLQQLREYLHHAAAFAGRRQPPGLPAAARRCRNREDRRHGVRRRGVPGDVPLQPHEGHGPAGQLRNLPGQGGAGRAQRAAAGGDRARGVHRTHRGYTLLPVEDLRRRHR